MSTIGSGKTPKYSTQTERDVGTRKDVWRVNLEERDDKVYDIAIHIVSEKKSFLNR